MTYTPISFEKDITFFWNLEKNIIHLQTLTKEDDMEVKLTNVGKITAANIKLNSLTVVAGVNDSGKSTIGKTLFLAIKALTNSKNKTTEDKTERINECASELYSILGTARFQDKGLMEVLPITPEELSKKLLSISDQHSRVDFLNIIIKALDSEALLPRNRSRATDVLINIMAILQNDGKYNDLKNEIDSLIQSEFLGRLSQDNKDESQIAIADDYGKSLTFSIKGNKCFDIDIPSDGISMFDDITYIESPLYMHLLKTITSVSTIGRGILSPHIIDMAQKINYAGTITTTKDTLLSNINSIIDGKFIIDPTTLALSFQRGESNFPIINIASGMKSFGILQMLLQGRIIDYDKMLVWDEPENHLHPEWQLKFAEVLVQLAKNGITILVTSHSPYFIQAIRYFSAKYSNESNTYYYLAVSNENGDATSLRDVTECVNDIFYLLSAPLDDVMNVDAARDKYSKIQSK